MKVPCLPNQCAMEEVTRLLSGPWTAYVVWVLRMNGAMRFGALKREIKGISTRVLTVRLRHLEEYGLLWRHVVATVPPQVTYELSPRGLELSTAMTQLNELALQWQAQDSAGPAE